MPIVGDEEKKVLVEKYFEQRKEEQIKEFADLKRRYAELRAAESIATTEELEAKVKTSDDGEGKGLLAKLVNQADRIINAQVTTNIDWKSSMMDLVNMFQTLSMAGNLMLHAKFYEPLRALIIDKGLLGLHDRIKYRPDGKVDLPTLQHGVGFTNDNRLDAIQLTNADKGEISDKVNDAFRKVVTVWLKKLGYDEVSSPDPSKPTGVFMKDGVQLTKDKFDELKADDENGLGQFLKDDKGLEFKDTLDAPSTPTP